MSSPSQINNFWDTDGLVSSNRLHGRIQGGGNLVMAPPKPRKKGIIKLPKTFSIFFESEFGSIPKKIVGEIRGVFSFGGALGWD